MSYETVREHLVRCRSAVEENGDETRNLVDALEQLTTVLEADLTQIKAALSHIARQLEEPQN